MGGRNEKIHKKIVIIISSLILLTAVSLAGIYPSIYEFLCKTRVYENFSNNVEDIFSANICVIGVTKNEDDVTIISYSTGASGVIFSKNNNKYYALTAYHVFADKDKCLIYTINSDTIGEYRKKHTGNGHGSLDEYYGQFPEAKLEYICEESDLAILSFETDEELAVVSISQSMPAKGDKILIVGNPEGEHFVKTYGKITSKNLTEFKVADEMENKVLKHNAYVTFGTSGGAALNESMELVGIAVGGGTDFFGRFRYGVIIPCDQICQFIDESNM